MAQSITDLKVGRIVKIGNDPHVIISSQFLRKQMRKPVMKTKLKNLVNSATIEKNFMAGEAFEIVQVESKKCQYLYKDDIAGYFMEQESFEQFSVPVDMIEEQLKFLLEGNDVLVVFYEDRPIGVELPFKVDLKVSDTPPGVRGDTASGGGKPATLETGLVVQVPFFINNGDIIKINTETYEYVERVQK